MKTLFSLFVFLIGLSAIQAQTVNITVTEDGKPMAYHDITLSHGDYVLGTGRTNSSGKVSISAPNLRSKSVDVAGKYQNGGTKKEWSIKGKILLDSRNSIHIKLEEMKEDMNKDRADMDARKAEMERKRDKMFGKKEKDDDDDDDDDIYGSGGSTGQEKKGGNTGSSSAMSNKDFKAALSELKGISSAFTQKDKALDLVKNNALSTSQIKDVLSNITSSFSQKDVAIAAYDNCTDKQNYRAVIETMSSTFMQKDVEKATIGK